jgi:hypothetical protein
VSGGLFKNEKAGKKMTLPGHLMSQRYLFLNFLVATTRPNIDGGLIVTKATFVPHQKTVVVFKVFSKTDPFLFIWNNPSFR